MDICAGSFCEETIILMMKRLKIIFGLILCFWMPLLIGACHNDVEPDAVAERVYVPVEPDYTDPRMWHVIKNGADWWGAGVVYIPST